jgi:glutathione S-transferase
MRVHYNPASQHSRRVKMVALELGLDVEFKLVDFSKAENRGDEYLKKNVMGKVPTLEDGDFLLPESNAIMQYLADGSALYPTDKKQRAQINRWLFWEQAHFGPACTTLTWERVMKPMMMKQEPNPVLVAEGERNFQRYGAVLNAQLETRQFVAGELSIADFALATITCYRGPANIDTGSFRHLQAWLDRIEARDSWKQTIPQF